ncbi:MAG: translation initiation factor IF-2 subunit alpha [Desulfurococcales archaeon]|jgi:translation initiation factor 2 subunit 1|uniref:Translation initiation factor IF-2 subunit alpha n=1 Tax=Fervidicoccus fontis TaxID=683846 RepID=A0A7J3SN32_9CREN|nr:translation initiation factor IF-2 subunit alpha [Desulfurococcales archaeon]
MEIGKRWYATVRSRKDFPDANELVVATVKEIFDYGAYVELDEYKNMRAYLPWSEVASKWVKDVKDIIRQGEKIVVKVIRVNRQKGQVDVSLKRVYDAEKKKKMQWFKRNQRAEKVLQIAAQRIGKSLDEAYREAGWPLEDHYGDIYSGLEAAVLEGPDALRSAGIKEEWVVPLYEESVKHIQIKQVKLSGTVNLKSLEPDGVERIRKVLLTIKSSASDQVKVNVYSIGAPKYKVEIITSDYKVGERALEKAIQEAGREAQRKKVEMTFVRDRT